jgi:hypothetical protein
MSERHAIIEQAWRLSVAQLGVPLMQKSATHDGLVYKTHEGEQAQTSEGQAGQEWNDWCVGLIEREMAPLHKAIGETLAAERQLQRKERAAELAPLRTEIAELRGQVATLLALFGTKADVGALDRKLG